MRSSLSLENFGDGKLPHAVAQAIEVVRQHLHDFPADDRERKISIDLTLKPPAKGAPTDMVLTGYVVTPSTPKTKPVLGVAFDTPEGLVADSSTEPTGQMRVPGTEPLPENVKALIKKEERHG